MQTAASLLTFELARRLENSGITANAIHPGLARSGLMKEAFVLTRLASSPPEKLTGPILQAAAAPEFASTSGKFLHDGKEIEAPVYAHDRTAQQRLWEMSEALTGLALTKGELPINDPKI